MIKSINPVTNKIIKTYRPFSDKKILSIVDSVSLEFEKWKFLSYDNRSKTLYNIANDLKSNIEEHAQMISMEMGKPIAESRMEIDKCVWVLKYFADNASNFLKNREIKTEYSESYILLKKTDTK